MPLDYIAMLLRDMQAIGDGAGAQGTNIVARIAGRPPTAFAESAARAAHAASRP